MVEIVHKMGNGAPKDEEFVIERLYRGSVVNHNSFLMNDDIDTDAKCMSAVNVYVMSLATVTNLRNRHFDLD